MKLLGQTKKWMVLLPAFSLLAACGYQPMPTAPGQNPYQNAYTNPYTSPTNQNPYQSAAPAYDQYGQSDPYGQPYGQNGQYGQNTPYGNGGGFYSTPGSETGLPGDVPYTGAPGASAYPGTAPTPAPAADPNDKAPDPIPAQVFNQVGEELNVLSYNVWGLPGILGTKRKERFSRLGPTLNAYDVVTLQEAYADDIETLKTTSGFPHHARIDNDTLIKTGSGLYTLSKYPILKTEYMEFNHCTGTDCLTRKGVLLTRIDHPKIGPVDVYSASYQSGDSAKAKDIRAQQQNRLLQEMIQRNKSNFPVILTGNFEFVPEQSEYMNLLERMPLVDVYARLHPDEGGYTVSPDNPNLKGEGVPLRLDYIFALKKEGIEVSPVQAAVTHNQPIDGYVLSDHYGVSAKFKINIKK